MDEQITRQDLLDLERRLTQQIADVDRRLTEVEARLKQDVAEVEARLKQELVSLEERMRQFTRELVNEVETKLLSAFFNYAERTEKVLERLTTDIRHLHLADQNLEDRMRALEARVFNLEKKLLQQPPAA